MRVPVAPRAYEDIMEKLDRVMAARRSDLLSAHSSASSVEPALSAPEDYGNFDCVGQFGDW